MKRLIVCNDGTWNTPDQEDNGIPSPTNVVKFSNALATADGQGVEQLKYYHPGVGTNGFLDSITGGALGKGVDNQIISAYHWLGTHYEEGDEIFIVGFSRGAFVARSLGGFLGRGLLDLEGTSSKEAWSRVKTAFDEGYRKYDKGSDDPRVWAAGWKFFHSGKAAPVRFIGVWDTVGALGVPDDLELLNLFDDIKAWHFHDTALGSHIQTARHAMAIDEVRASFTVTRWSNTDKHPDASEVWFPGVHSDVGGGYANTDLSDGALLWMLEESEAIGLAFRGGIKTLIQPNPLGPLHNSYKGAFAKLRSRPRAMEAFVQANHSLFHTSAVKRQTVSPLGYPAYRPTRILNIKESVSLEIHADTRWNDTGLYLEKGHSYKFSAKGEWLDSKDACDWKGTENDDFTMGDFFRASGTALGKLETMTKKITGNLSTDFLLTKRVEELRWFVMVGAIGNDSGSDAGLYAKVPNDGSPSPHEYVDLTSYKSKPLTIKNPGYLYCFPNDVWSLYNNNHGSVCLTVTRVS